MRESFMKTNIIYSNNTIIGVSLGFDFTAEHEWGIKDLKHKLGIPEYIKTYKDLLIKHPKNLFFIESQDFYTISSMHNSLKKYIENRKKDVLYAFWDWSDFGIVFYDENEYKAIKSLFENKQMILASQEILMYIQQYIQDDVGGIVFIDYHQIPQSVLDDIKQNVKSRENLQKAVDKIGIIQKIKEKQQEWKHQYPQSLHSPWDYYGLSPQWDDDEGIMFWLNPAHQNELGSDFVTISDLEDWLEGKGKIIKGNWNKLQFECKNSELNFIEHAYQYFTGKPCKHWTKNILHGSFKNKLDKNMIDVIEGHVKWIIKDCIEVQNRYFHSIPSIGCVDLSTSREVDERVFGIFETLEAFGLGYFGAINTPCVKENFSWWKDILKEEVKFMLVKQYYPEELNDEWYKR